ncbi:MAG: 2-oxoacid:acceptor oxidoreductase family protein [Gammaproteobacteria bacterium]|nr:2-oxoacid:acceptor oxidoreductase family protein [Gammaproteobacteria bacterium]
MHHSQAKRLLKGQSGNDQGGTGQQRELRESEPRQSRYPGIEAVIHGNGAVAHVMGQVCGGVIGYPITPSTEISELFEAFRAAGGCNVWGKHPFFFEPEGEHSAQSGAMGAALTGGRYISNASSSQGILYGLESHYVTVGKKIGGFVLQIAARVVSRHSLNVMAGHDDVYALLPSGYTILFASNPQEAADLAAIAYRVSALSLIPVANAMDGFATSHMQSEVRLPEPELLREFLGDPESWIPAPTVAQEILYGARGRVFQLSQYLQRHQADVPADDLASLRAFLNDRADEIENDNLGALIDTCYGWIPEELRAQWRRQWLNAHQKGTRQLVPALVDVNNPGLTGGVQNQPDFQAGSIDHKSHFANEVPRFVTQAMDEYADLTGRVYRPVQTFMAEDADHVIVGLGSVTDDAEAVAAYLRRQGKKVGVVSIKLLHPFPEAELVKALDGRQAVTVLERSEVTSLTSLVTQALFKGRENGAFVRHPGIPPISELPKLSTGIFGLGAHDLQPRDLIAAFHNMESSINVPFFYLGSQFFSEHPSNAMAGIQKRLRDAYPETEFMTFKTAPNPRLLPEEAFRVRFHSIGGYGTIATGKLLTDILAGLLGMHSKSSPKYGSEKSGAPTNFYISFSPEPIKITNAELEDVEIVVSPDHKVFSHTNPLKGLVRGGTFILQSHHTPIEVWKELPAHARKTIRENDIHLYIVDAFRVAKRHAPAPDLEIRMMGIAFIGAVCGHVDRIVADATEASILEKIKRQVIKKFGTKGETVVASNMSVIQEGLHATHKVDYQQAEYLEAEKLVPVQSGPGVEVSASMSRALSRSATAGFFDQEYYRETVSDRFKDGGIGSAPVLPGVGMFMPVASAAWRDKGLFRLQVPSYTAHLCTGCMECAVVCPDAAIPNTVHEIHDLLLTAIAGLQVTDQQRNLLSSHVYPLTKSVRDIYRNLPSKDSKSFHEIVAEAVREIETENLSLKRGFQEMVDSLEVFPVAKTRPFFDVMEKAVPGSGGLYSVNVDPWKCSGCLECVDVCGPGALSSVPQDSTMLRALQGSFQFLSKLPNTPARFTENAIHPGGDTKRLLLDHDNYYSMTGGHGACRGCGEVTAIRLLTATNRAIHENRRKAHVHELEDLIKRLDDKLGKIVHDDHDPNRRQRMTKTRETLEARLYRFESGPTGNGPAAATIANATGCSSVYASTFPYNPYTDPWVNSLFQDAVPVAKGLFEGLSASAVEDFGALRKARLDLEDHYDPDTHDTFFQYFHWSQFSEEEHRMLPAVISMGGDGATYDIGFGALSRLLVTDTPIKVVVLNTGAYSNTGGQSSTASFTAQDSDLSRFGLAHIGKQEDRKELGLIAAFHPKVLVVQANAALQAHFMKNVMEFLNYNDSPALLDVYTTCQSEHGIADDAGSRRARLAVESRMSPVFVHDPRRGDTLAERFSLEGNPEIGKDWITTTLDYVDDEGHAQLLEIPFTAADFALHEGRFKKHFHRVSESDGLIPVHQFIDLKKSDRYGKTPFIWSTDSERKLIKLAVSPAIIELTQERRRNWRMLEYLSGLHIDRLHESHRRELEDWERRYTQSNQEREASIDSIVRGMAELAAVSGAPPTPGEYQVPVSAITRMPATPSPGEAPAAASQSQPLVEIAEADLPKCTNCKTCYQDLSELFEKTKIVVDGESKEVSRVIPGVLERIELTPALIHRASRVADDCDAEIIRFHSPA